MQTPHKINCEVRHKPYHSQRIDRHSNAMTGLKKWWDIKDLSFNSWQISWDYATYKQKYQTQTITLTTSWQKFKHFHKFSPKYSLDTIAVLSKRCNRHSNITTNSTTELSKIPTMFLSDIWTDIHASWKIQPTETPTKRSKDMAWPCRK